MSYDFTGRREYTNHPQLRYLCRLAYVKPEKAGKIAREQGVYLDFMWRLMRVHAKMTGIFYRGSNGRKN